MEKTRQGIIVLSEGVYLSDQRATAHWATITNGKIRWSATAYQLDRNMRKTKKKQLMIMAKALYLNQPKGSTYTLRQIIQRLKDVVKQKDS